jgi:ABC-type glycerol-3-phosphate transport system substrate-binding protein
MRLRWLAIMWVGLVSACAPQAAQPTQLLVTEEISITSTPIVIEPTPVAIATEETPAPEGLTLNIWWPEPLAPIDNQDAADLLSEQISAFQAANHDVTVEFRLKKAQDVGGIMSALRAASLVAPGAVPDLTLMRRSDLLAAAQSSLIMPIDEQAEAAVLDNLHPMVNTLGRFNERLYGLPYNVEVQHIAYQAGLYDAENWDFAGVLTRERAFVFPAGRATSLSDIFLAQYRSATETQNSTTLDVNTEQLETLFQFYQQAVSEDLIDPIVLEYIIPEDYRSGLAAGTIPAGVVTSTMFLGMLSEGALLDAAPIPTASGEPTTIVDSWMWVLTSADAEQQAVALRFLNWMMDLDRQGNYNRAIHMLPSQRSALRQWEDSDYAVFVDTLLNGATLPLSESAGSLTARVIQGALASVISGQRTPEEAAQDVIAQLPS